jgi:hypothetical protein
MILPVKEYEPLKLLLQDPELHVASALGDVTSERDNVSKALTRYYDGINMSQQYVTTMATREVNQTSETH